MLNLGLLFISVEEVGPEARKIMAKNEFEFTPPVNFIDAKKYHPSKRTFERIGLLPDCVVRCIVDVLPPNLDIDAVTVFFYVKRGYVPAWLVNFFIDKQESTKASFAIKFIRAIHLISMVRAELYQLYQSSALSNVPAPASASEGSDATN